jgi:hypothetical protein
VLVELIVPWINQGFPIQAKFGELKGGSEPREKSLAVTLTPRRFETIRRLMRNKL